MAPSRQHRQFLLLCTTILLSLVLAPKTALAQPHSQHGSYNEHSHEAFNEPAFDEPPHHPSDDWDFRELSHHSPFGWGDDGPHHEPPHHPGHGHGPPDHDHRPPHGHHHGSNPPFAPYLLPGELPDGRQKEFFREEWRVIGADLDTPEVADKLAEISETIYLSYSFLGRLHSVSASIAAPTRLDGKAVSAADLAGDYFSRQVLSAYNSLSVQVDFSIDNRACYPDLGNVAATNYNRMKNILSSAGHQVVAWLCWQYTLTFEARITLGHMPIPEYRSYLVKLKVTGANLVPFTLQKQNAVSATISDQLRFDSVFSVRLISVDQNSPEPGQNVSSAEVSLVVQQDESALYVEEALISVVTDPLGTPLFDVKTAQVGLPMSAVIISVEDYWGDSITDQVIPAPDGPPPLGWFQMGGLLLGVAVLAAFAAVLSVYLRKRQLTAPAELQMQQITPRLIPTLPQPATMPRATKTMQHGGEVAGLYHATGSMINSQLQDEPLYPYSQSEDAPLLLHQQQAPFRMYTRQHSEGSERQIAYERQITHGGRLAHERQIAQGAERPAQDLQASSYYPFREDSCSVQSGKLTSRHSESNSSSEHSLSLSQVEFSPDQGQLHLKQGQSNMHQGRSTHQSISSQRLPAAQAGQSQQASTAPQEWVIDPNQICICEHPRGGPWQLGIGSFGVVYKARKGTQDVAVKTIHSRWMSPHVSASEAADNMNMELQMWKTLSHHKNLVRFYGSCEQDGRVSLVLEYMEGGDLRHALKTIDGRAEQLRWHNKGAKIALDVIQGIQFLHSYGVMHRDIKSGNVLLSGDFSQAKICDVGLAHIMGSTSNSGKSVQATFAYAAPEMLFNYRCNEKADIFSYGVVLWEIITQETPQRGTLRDIKVPAECPPEIAHLVERCLDENPVNRPTAEDIVKIINDSV